MIDRMACLAMRQRIAAVIAGGADRRERLEVESHARSCAACADAYRDLAQTAIAVDRAYAPLRYATVALSPARVRLAARAPLPIPLSIRLGRLSSRLSEVALAAAVTAFAFVGSASVAPQPAIVDETSSETLTHVTAGTDDQSFLRWIRLGRYAASQDLVDSAASSLVPEEDDAINGSTHERVGLAR